MWMTYTAFASIKWVINNLQHKSTQFMYINMVAMQFYRVITHEVVAITTKGRERTFTCQRAVMIQTSWIYVNQVMKKKKQQQQLRRLEKLEDNLGSCIHFFSLIKITTWIKIDREYCKRSDCISNERFAVDLT